MHCLSTLEKTFENVSRSDCPCSSNDFSGCTDLPNCSNGMSTYELCEANIRLPDGNDDYNVNNCGGAFEGFNVFRYVGGIQKFLREDIKIIYKMALLVYFL